MPAERAGTEVMTGRLVDFFMMFKVPCVDCLGKSGAQCRVTIADREEKSKGKSRKIGKSSKLCEKRICKNEIRQYLIRRSKNQTSCSGGGMADALA